MVLARTPDRHPPHQMPFDRRPDVHRDIALALLEFAGDVVERQRLRFEIKQSENAALELVQHSGGCGGRPDAVDEDCTGSVHRTFYLEGLEYSERTVNHVCEFRDYVAERNGFEPAVSETS